jgi:hypothetical protein
MATNRKVSGKTSSSGTASISSPNSKPGTWKGQTKLSSSEILSLRQDKRMTIEKAKSAKR